ncbi:hypothetical protein F53441_1453 [Fusarium austroafricanum]|uniref:Uncharacterized protein n=1 Tax=Fusarium austroafricanum TaxID=2364996 RepID=A0A8H4KVB1_9HYPO|nr:hypothetical protein F53441_1453 [Fusarium austroafricanum]
MCKPVRYVYPDCGHPVDSDPDKWIVESCLTAISLNRDCWIPKGLPDEYIEKKPWPNNNLGFCPMSHKPQQVEEVESMVEDIQTEDIVAHEENYYNSTALEPSIQSEHQPEDQDQDQEEPEIENHEHDDIPTPQGMIFDEQKLIGNKHIFRELEPLHLNSNEPLLIDELPLLDADEMNRFEAAIWQDYQPVITDQDIANIVQVLEETADELAIASVEDNLDWALVTAVDLSVPVDPFYESEDDDFDIDIDMVWF